MNAGETLFWHFHMMLLFQALSFSVLRLLLCVLVSIFVTARWSSFPACRLCKGLEPLRFLNVTLNSNFSQFQKSKAFGLQELAAPQSFSGISCTVCHNVLFFLPAGRKLCGSIC